MTNTNTNSAPLDLEALVRKLTDEGYPRNWVRVYLDQLIGIDGSGNEQAKQDWEGQLRQLDDELSVVTDQDIEALEQEAAIAGDGIMSELCLWALHGSATCRRRAAAVIVDNRDLQGPL